MCTSDLPCQLNHVIIVIYFINNKPRKYCLRQCSAWLSLQRCRSTDVAAKSGGEQCRRFEVGVLGAGRIGRLHLQNVLSHRGLKLRWVVEDSQEAVQQATRQLMLHDTPFHPTADLPELLKDHR